MVAAVDLWNVIATAMMDDDDDKYKHIWENPPGKHFAVRAWWNEPDYEVTDKNGKKRIVKGGKAYIRPLKSVFEVAEWVGNPIAKLAWKFSPMISAMAGLFFPSRYDKNYEGIKDVPEQLGNFILDVTEPIQFSQISDFMKGKKSALGATLPFFGMPTSKYSIVNERSDKLKELNKLSEKDDVKANSMRQNWNRKHPEYKISKKDGKYVAK